MKLTAFEKKTYVLNDNKDLVILSKIKKLEEKELTKKDKEIIKLIRTQPKKNWRLPLIKYLDKLLKKYKK